MLAPVSWLLLPALSILQTASISIPDCSWNKWSARCGLDARSTRVIYNLTSARCEVKPVCNDVISGTFVSLEQCRSQCECPVLPDMRDCGRREQRFLYDPAIGRCRKFSHGGCGRHFNNFESLSQCKSACICATSHDPYACARERPPCYYFDTKTFRCRQDNSPRCGVTYNRFRSLEHCRDECVCSLDYDAGSCQSYIPFYYYNMWSERCEWFYYKGCGGNGNRFWTKSDCQAACPVWT